MIVTEAIVISYVNKLCVEETVRWIDIKIVDFPRRPGLCRLPALFLVISGAWMRWSALWRTRKFGGAVTSRKVGPAMHF